MWTARSPSPTRRNQVTIRSDRELIDRSRGPINVTSETSERKGKQHSTPVPSEKAPKQKRTKCSREVWVGGDCGGESSQGRLRCMQTAERKLDQGQWGGLRFGALQVVQQVQNHSHYDGVVRALVFDWLAIKRSIDRFRVGTSQHTHTGFTIVVVRLFSSDLGFGPPIRTYLCTNVN